MNTIHLNPKRIDRVKYKIQQHKKVFRNMLGQGVKYPQEKQPKKKKKQTCTATNRTANKWRQRTAGNKHNV